MLRLAAWGAVYFAMVFGVGFALGPIRVLWLEPRVGVRLAQLIEAPLLCLAIVLAGGWVGRRLSREYGARGRLGVGLLAAALVLAADVAVGIVLRGMSVVEVFSQRDPVAGPVYYALVAFTAVAPWLLGRRRSAHGD